MLKKSCFAFLLVISYLSFLVSGCKNFLASSDSDFSADEKIASLEIVPSEIVPAQSASKSPARALDLSENGVCYAVVSISGTGIGALCSSDYVQVSGGKGSSVVVKNIPVGRNRIVTVQGYDKDKNAVNGAVIRNITDISQGSNSCSVTQSTTALGNVFNSLLAKNHNLNSVEKADIEKIKDAIDSSKSWALIDTAKIASDYISGSLSGKTSYYVSTGTVNIVNETSDSSYLIKILDPSSPVTNVGSGTQISDSAPGVWSVQLLDSSKNILASASDLKVISGKTSTVTVEKSGSSSSGLILKIENAYNPADGITVHAKYKYIYIWDSGVKELDESSQAMTSEGDGWYYYEIPASSAKIIFKQDSDWTGQTGDLSRSEKGEWWYSSGKWYDGNPEDSVAPVLTSFGSDKTGTVSGIVILTAAATDDKNLKSVTFSLADGTELSVGNVTGTSGTATYSWDTTKIQNGTYTIKAVAKDAAGNSSSEKTLVLTTDNKNLPPVAVINGSSTAKIGSSKTYNASSSYDQNGGTIVSYSWSVFGGATVQGGSNSESVTVIMPSSVTTVTISLTVTDNDGASSESVSKTVTVKEGTSENWDFRDETIYFLMTTRFYDGDESNNAYCWDDEECFNSVTLGDPGWRGDFKGLIEKLDYIKALGFSAVWITPVVENSSGLDYHGYHASNFEKVDPRYAGVGEDPMEAYQKLIDACHAKGIKVIQDIVLNHTSNFGENGFFRIFDTSNKARGSDGVTPAITVFATDSSNGVFDDALYGLTSLNKALGSSDYWNLAGSRQYDMRIAAMKEDSNDTLRAYHHEKSIQWEGYTVQTGQMAGDCVDINTENHKVAEYIRNAYIKYIDMGVDAFRIDTVKHISRLTFNKEFLPYFKQAGEDNGKDFFMFGEGCVLRNEVWNDNKPPISVPFYTWKGNDDSYSWSETNPEANEATVLQHFEDNLDVSAQPTSNNAFLNGNTYHAPDRSESSGLDMIDFYMHHKFGSAGSAFGVAAEEDRYFNDATYNVTYVDSHDYGPNEGGYLYTRFSGGTQAWASNLNLMFTFRGIPCVYYGTEIEFQKDMQIEPYTNGNKVPYARSGRAYFGDHLEGNVTATDFGEYTASGEVEDTLNHDLAQHIIRLNKIRRAIPALRKGQYSTQNCSGSIAFKRRYTDNEVDSFALVAINSSATFSGLPAGNYVEVITGNSVSIGEGGSITTDSIGEGNMRVYVNTSLNGCEVSGKIGTAGAYLK